MTERERFESGSARCVAVFTNMAKPHAARELGLLTSWLRRRGLEVRVPPDPAPWNATRPDLLARQQFLAGVDLLIVLGGDGTLLAAARLVYPLPVPILGVNFGGLGFLTDVSVDTMLSSLERVLDGDGRIETRMMLRACVVDRAGKELHKLYGLNDVVLHEANRRAIDIESTLAGTPLGRFRADGIIIATPTGSTAYSLSAGGPIIQPTLNVLIATPICPHSFSLRPLVFPADETIEFRVRQPEAFAGESLADLTVDGQVLLDFAPEHTLRVRRAGRTIRFLVVESRSFYEVLRQKLRWGGV